MIHVSHISKTYPSQVSALSDVSLEISPGEFTYVAGPSGSGKTTLLRILFGAERPTSGEAVVNEIHITEKGLGTTYPLRRTMGIIFEEPKLLRDRSVGENIALSLEVTGHFGKEVREKVSQVLAEVGLQAREKDSILYLSAGEQQRVAIARALVHNPPLLLADEPTGNLDLRTTDDVLKIIGHLHEKGTTILFATHDMDLLQRYPRRTVYLEAGKIMENVRT
jgi:cell division transport system ATP-binding protein